MVILPALLLGCSGANEETLVDELRVLAMVPAAPEIAPMETTDVDTFVVDPAGDGASVLVWTCTRLGETCLEDDEGRTVSVVEPDETGHVHTDVTASAALAAVASESPLPLVSVWALACVDADTCPIFADVADGTTVDADTWADPTDLMRELPISGTSLAFTSLSVSTRTPDTRHVNPTVEVTTNKDTVAPGKKLKVSAQLAGELGDEAHVWGYAEAGGFTETDDRPNQNQKARLDWIAPDEAGDVTAWLVVVDGLGGSALWEGTFTAE